MANKRKSVGQFWMNVYISPQIVAIATRSLQATIHIFN